MKEDPKIDEPRPSEGLDELLNSFIDGELTAREQTEIQRLITHDAKIAQRVRQLQKCKMLMSSLPVAEAPDEILEDIKASLERKTLLGEQPSDFDERAGARYLLVRKVLAAAAMIGLVTVLAAVVHTIVTPETVPERPVAKENSKLKTQNLKLLHRPSMVAMEFGGRLELKTSALVAVDAFINKAIEDNGLSGSISPAPPFLLSQESRGVYSLSCSREDLNLLLADLGSIWEKFDSATLFVETEVFGRQVVVNAVTAEQIAEIVNQDSLQRRTEVARDLALLNNTAERLPGREIIDPRFSILDSRRVTSIWHRASRIPKPGLTWRQQSSKLKTQNSKLLNVGPESSKLKTQNSKLLNVGPESSKLKTQNSKVQVHLVIVVAGSE